MKQTTYTLSPGAPFPPSQNDFVKKNYPLPLPSLFTTKKNISRKKMYPFPPSSFHISNEGKKKTLTSTPLPLNSVKNKK